MHPGYISGAKEEVRCYESRFSGLVGRERAMSKRSAFLGETARSGSYIGEVEAITYPNIVTKFRMVCPNN